MAKKTTATELVGRLRVVEGMGQMWPGPCLSFGTHDHQGHQLTIKATLDKKTIVLEEEGYPYRAIDTADLMRAMLDAKPEEGGARGSSA